MYEVITYRNKNGKDTVKEYIEELVIKSETSKNDKIKLDKILQYIKFLEKSGTRLGKPKVDYLGGDLWELRPINDRIIFFYWTNRIFVLLHHFRKKTQKTPKKELEQAKRNMIDFINRGGNK